MADLIDEILQEQFDRYKAACQPTNPIQRFKLWKKQTNLSELLLGKLLPLAVSVGVLFATYGLLTATKASVSDSEVNTRLAYETARIERAPVLVLKCQRVSAGQPFDPSEPLVWDTSPRERDAIPVTFPSIADQELLALSGHGGRVAECIVRNFGHLPVLNVYVPVTFNIWIRPVAYDASNRQMSVVGTPIGTFALDIEPNGSGKFGIVNLHGPEVGVTMSFSSVTFATPPDSTPQTVPIAIDGSSLSIIQTPKPSAANSTIGPACPPYLVCPSPFESPNR